MRPLRAITAAAVLSLTAGFSLAGEKAPRAWISLSATNLTVTESAVATINLRLPPLKPPYEKSPPILNQRPPHIDAPFLERDWKPDVIALGDLNELGKAKGGRNGDTRVFTLNKYVSDSLFSSMRDPFGFFGDDPFDTFGPKPQRFPFEVKRDDGGNWFFTVQVPVFTAKSPGKVRFDAAEITVPVVAEIDNRNRVRLNTLKLRTEPVEISVSQPPEEGRLKGWSGAIGRSMHVVAGLDANICTAGDPLTFSLEVTGDFAQETLLPPDLPRLVGTTAFRIDAASVKTVTQSGGKRFTWRVRALKAGTHEFPAFSVAYYDVAKRVYVPVSTEPVPIQIKAGAQAALGVLEEEDDVFPVPDGLDLDFHLSGNEDFTLRRAFSLAMRASKPQEFSAAVKAYEEYLSKNAAMERPIKARHLCNVASLYYMAGEYRKSLEVFGKAERVAGETSASLHGVRAAWARLRNDPRADLPLQRILFPFWFKYSMPVRISIAGGFLLALVSMFVIAAKTGSRFAVIALTAGYAACADAQLFDFNIASGAAADVKGRMILEPSKIVVGQPCLFIVELDTGNGVGIERLQISGMPDPSTGAVEYGEAFEPLADGKSPAKGRAVRRFRMKARFLSAYTGTVSPVVSGMAVTRRSSRFGSSSFMNSFNLRLAPFKAEVAPLPEQGRPEGFSGAVGTAFRLEETFTPNRVRPGDLVKVTYTLKYDGYLPAGIKPETDGWGKDFKVWEIKEISRKDGEAVWEQMIAPQNVSAVKGVSARVDYFDLSSRKYSVARAIRPELVFVSAEKASTENTSVTVTGNEEENTEKTQGERAETSLDVRFAPSEKSPVLFKLPSGASYTELHINGAWVRISSQRGVGWIKNGKPRR